MTHETKTQILLFGIFLFCLICLLISIVFWIFDYKKKLDTSMDIDLFIYSIVGLLATLIYHWYCS